MNAHHKGKVIAREGWLHMNAYSVFLSPRFETGTKKEEKAKNDGKVADTGIKQRFGPPIVSNFFSSTAKLAQGIQYIEGQ